MFNTIHLFNTIHRGYVLTKHESVEVKCANIGNFGCPLSNLANMLKRRSVIDVEYMLEEKRVVLTPKKHNPANVITERLFYIVSEICNNCSNCPRYRYNEKVRQPVQKEPQPNIQVSPYITPHEEQKIQEVEKLPKINCKMLQNKKQNER